MDVDCRDSWSKVEKTDHSVCKIHNKLFKTSEGCPLTPSLPMETSKKKKEFKILKIKSVDDEKQKKGWDDLNKMNSPGEINTKTHKPKHKKVVTSQRMVVDLHEKGLSQSKIADELGVSQQYVSKVLRKIGSGGDGKKKERFHNFSLTFNAVFNYWSFPYKDVLFGRNNQYKVFDNIDFHVQIFTNGRIMIRYNKDVIGLKIVENEAEAIRRILEFMNEWNSSNKFGIRFIDYVISSGHNEFMGNAIAHRLARQGQTIKYKDRDDGKDRTIIDFSPSKDNPSGAPHFEHTHKLHYNPDSQKWEEILDDVATGNYEPLHTTKEKIAQIFDMLEKVARIQESSAIEAATVRSDVDKRLAWMDANFASHQRVLEKIESKIDKIPSPGSSSSSSSPTVRGRSRRFSKKDRVDQYMRKYGWR